MKTTQDIYPTFTEAQVIFSCLPKIGLDLIERAKRGEKIVFKGKISALKQDVVCQLGEYTNRLTCIPRVFRKLKVVSI